MKIISNPILDGHVILHSLRKEMLLALYNVSNKYPKFINHLMNLFLIHPYDEHYSGMIADIYKKQIKYKNILNKEKFSILNFDDIEKMDDAIEYIKLVHSSHKLLKSIISKSDFQIPKNKYVERAGLNAFSTYAILKDGLTTELNFSRQT